MPRSKNPPERSIGGSFCDACAVGASRASETTDSASWSKPTRQHALPTARSLDAGCPRIIHAPTGGTSAPPARLPDALGHGLP